MTVEPMTDCGGRTRRPTPIRWMARSASAIGIWSLVIGHSAMAGGAQRIPLAAAVHVHTTFSSGAEDLDSVARRARAAGLQAVLFTENYGLAFDYGIEPLAGILRWRESFPSVTPGRLAAYLEAVRQARRRHPDLILMPGLEVIPHYYWTGSLRDRNLTMYDGQKNLLVFGLERPEELRALPVVGNRRWPRPGDWLAHLAPPALLGAAGGCLFRLRRVRRVRWRQFEVRQMVRYRWAGACAIALAALFALNSVLAGTPHWNPKRGPRGYAPHQAAIAFVAARGGAAVWSMPEARDFSVHRRAGLTVTVRTDPYPEALAETQGYTAFGALYGDTTSVEAPGGLWDRLLLDHLAGRRPGWPVAIGETAYHYEGQAGKRLDDVQTVFLAAAPTPAAVLEAMREGRAYSLRRMGEYVLVLERFAVNGAGPGDTAPAAPGAPPRIAVALAASDGKAHPVEARLIRSGAVLAVRQGTTPLALDLEDREAPKAGAWYYRLDVHGEPGVRLLTNPIFIRGPA